VSTLRKDEVARVLEVRKPLRSTSFPSVTNLRSAVLRGNIVGAPFSIKDIDNYQYIHKHEVSELRGKVRWQRSLNYRETPVQVDLLLEVLRRPRQVG